jgi:O-succinylbenzoate synthase
MRLHRVELITLDVTLRHPVGTAAGVHDSRPLLFVRVIAGDGEGWGECSALAAGTSVDPPLAAVAAAMADVVVPRLFTATATRGGELPAAWQIARLFGGRSTDAMAGAAMEMALLDLEARAGGWSLLQRLAPGHPARPAGVAVGTMVGIPKRHDLATLCEAVGEQVDAGTARVRVKIEPGWDRVPLFALRRQHPELALQADANGSYRQGTGDVDDVGRLVALDDLSLTCIEQPLPPADLAAMAEVATLLATPVCLDESLSSPHRVTDAIRAGAGSVACLKPGRLGGLLAARRAAVECRSAGMQAFVGGFFESGLGRSANVALAHCDGFSLPGDLGSPAGYLDADPFTYPPVRDGRVRAPEGPGITGLPGPADLSGLTQVRRGFDFPA